MPPNGALLSIANNIIADAGPPPIENTLVRTAKALRHRARLAMVAKARHKIVGIPGFRTLSLAQAPEVVHFRLFFDLGCR